jgi:hypothetical protein
MIRGAFVLQALRSIVERHQWDELLDRLSRL